jgi:isopenicillin N synthase-like dioxygenase
MSIPTFTEIPTIDLRLSDGPGRSRVLSDLHHALTAVGFLYISHHGVSEEAIVALVKILPTLFSLPATAKAEVALENSPHFLGSSAVGSETTAGRQDSREQFEFATELPSIWEPGLPLYERLVGPNQVRSSLLSPSRAIKVGANRTSGRAHVLISSLSSADICTR